MTKKNSSVLSPERVTSLRTEALPVPKAIQIIAELSARYWVRKQSKEQICEGESDGTLQNQRPRS